MLNILDMHVYLEMSGEVPRFCSILLRDLQPDKPSQMLIGVGGELMESYHHLWLLRNDDKYTLLKFGF